MAALTNADQLQDAVQQLRHPLDAYVPDPSGAAPMWRAGVRHAAGEHGRGRSTPGLRGGARVRRPSRRMYRRVGDSFHRPHRSGVSRMWNADEPPNTRTSVVWLQLRQPHPCSTGLVQPRRRYACRGRRRRLIRSRRCHCTMWSCCCDASSGYCTPYPPQSTTSTFARWPCSGPPATFSLWPCLAASGSAVPDCQRTSRAPHWAVSTAVDMSVV